MDDIKKTIGCNISALRQTHSMTQLELAQSLNYTDKAVSKWERGDSVPDVIVLKQIADLFGVTIDFLVTNTNETPIPSTKEAPQKKHSRFIITLLSAFLVWFIATLLFVAASIFFPDFHRSWLIFVTAVPVCCIVLLIFNSIWGKAKLNYLIISILVWSFLLCVFSWFSTKALLPIFLVGIPAQIIIILWSKMIKK